MYIETDHFSDLHDTLHKLKFMIYLGHTLTCIPGLGLPLTLPKVLFLFLRVRYLGYIYNVICSIHCLEGVLLAYCITSIAQHASLSDVSGWLYML